MLSGDVNQVKRLKILEAFRAGNIRTVVATDVAGRGIHVDDIAFVVNYDFPYEPEDYVHRIGRTGRAGNTGTAISFADENESFAIPDIEAYINEPLKCTMPEEWMYAELPPLQPRDKKPRRHERVEKDADLAQQPAPEAIAAEAPTEETAPVVEAETPSTETPVVEAAPSVAEAPAVETTETAPISEAPAVEEPIAEQPADTAVKPTECVAAEPVKQEAAKTEEDKEEKPAPQKAKPAPKAQKSVRPEREPRFKPRGPKPQRNEKQPPKGPRSNKPVAQRFARTQADGPRDGSESHHAAPTSARPIYTPGHRGPISEEWTPGQ
jgi:superfamily II DNA/RNA helicase